MKNDNINNVINEDDTAKNDFAELKINNKITKLPIIKSVLGSNAVDVGNLNKQSEYFSYDTGFMSTASCKSSITYIDGEQGILRYRGYDIYDLAENSSFLEVSYLLLKGELPTEKEYKEFVKNVEDNTVINDELHNIFAAFRTNDHPMAILLSAISSLAAFYNEVDARSEIDIITTKMLAKMPTIAAMIYKHSINKEFIHPKNDLSFCENFLHMMFGDTRDIYSVNKTIARALDKIFILHADHEQNASTSTVRMVGSTDSNPFACIAAGVAALWGPAHGGANEAVIKMLEQIAEKDNIEHFVDRAKDKNDPFRLMGFGHRIYKNYDPRAHVLRDTCKEVLAEIGQKDNKLLQVAMELESLALNDEYFIKRKLYPNVDFYSGIIYKSLGIPNNMLTVMFAIARTAGWSAQLQEMIRDESTKLTRPRQLYIGREKRDFVVMNDRK